MWGRSAYHQENPLINHIKSFAKDSVRLSSLSFYRATLKGVPCQLTSINTNPCIMEYKHWRWWESHHWIWFQQRVPLQHHSVLLSIQFSPIAFSRKTALWIILIFSKLDEYRRNIEDRASTVVIVAMDLTDLLSFQLPLEGLCCPSAYPHALVLSIPAPESAPEV